jgi:hypothetical protein
MERVLRFLLAFSRRGARNGQDPLEFELPMTRNEIGGVLTFKGVRYAAPPFGVNRLQPPQAAEPWDGVRDALAFGRKLSNSRHRLRFVCWVLTTYAVLTSSAVRPLTGCGDDCDKLTSTYQRPSICVDSGSRLDREAPR